MLNSSHIQQKLDQGPKLKAICASGRKPAEILEELYLTILSRRPTADELKNAEEYGTGARKRPNDWVDIAWALFNSTEFLYRH